MPPKSARMSASQVRATIKNGRSARVAGLSLKYEPAPKAQVAAVVNKKVAPGAVERNRLRRLLYRSLPSPLPPARMVFFVQSATFDPALVAHLCSQLS